MNEIIQLGNIFENDKNVKLNKNPQPGRVYSIYGIAPTLSTMQGGHKVWNKVQKEIKSIRNEENILLCCYAWQVHR